MRKLLAALLLAALTVPALGQVVTVPPSNRYVGLSASSGTVAAATATATLAAGTNGETTFLCGFVITSTGQTAGPTVVAPTVVGLNGGTQTYAYTSVTGATLANPTLIVNFPACLPASAPNTAVVVSVPSLGAGNTNSTVNAWGFRLAARD